MKLPRAPQVDDARQRYHRSHRGLIRRQAQRQLPTSRMSCHDHLFRPQPIPRRNLRNETPRESNIIESARPPAPIIADAAILDIPRSESARVQCSTEVSGMHKVIPMAPEPSVDIHDDHIPAVPASESEFAELIAIPSIRHS